MDPILLRRFERIVCLATIFALLLELVLPILPAAAPARARAETTSNSTGTSSTRTVSNVNPGATPFASGNLPADSTRTTGPVETPSLQAAASRLKIGPIMFVENTGQYGAGARFEAQTGTGTLYLTDNALWLTILEQPQPVTPTLTTSRPNPSSKAIK